MKDETFVNGVHEGDDYFDILNWYRNLYHAENRTTEEGIMAEAISKLFDDLRQKTAQDKYWEREIKQLTEQRMRIRAEQSAKAPAETFPQAKSLIYGACFHGECWYNCPHCGTGIEAHSIGGLYIKQIRPDTYLCPKCKQEFYYKRA